MCAIMNLKLNNLRECNTLQITQNLQLARIS